MHCCLVYKGKGLAAESTSTAIFHIIVTESLECSGSPPALRIHIQKGVKLKLPAIKTLDSRFHSDSDESSFSVTHISHNHIIKVCCAIFSYRKLCVQQTSLNGQRRRKTPYDSEVEKIFFL
jgi:hypothetical protein